MFRLKMYELINNVIKSIRFIRYKPTNINLGRWNREDCNIKINKKIDFSNEDHCGCCGNNLLKK